jgi:hypothetical protein
MSYRLSETEKVIFLNTKSIPGDFLKISYRILKVTLLGKFNLVFFNGVKIVFFINKKYPKNSPQTT